MVMEGSEGVQGLVVKGRVRINVVEHVPYVW